MCTGIYFHSIYCVITAFYHQNKCTCICTHDNCSVHCARESFWSRTSLGSSAQLEVWTTGRKWVRKKMKRSGGRGPEEGQGPEERGGLGRTGIPQPTNQPTTPSICGEQRLLPEWRRWRERRTWRGMVCILMHVDAWGYSCMCAPPWERYVVCVGVERGWRAEERVQQTGWWIRAEESRL